MPGRTLSVCQCPTGRSSRWRFPGRAVPMWGSLGFVPMGERPVRMRDSYFLVLVLVLTFRFAGAVAWPLSARFPRSASLSYPSTAFARAVCM
jgi:hypothetical protein